MQVLAINCGSSSIKAALIETSDNYRVIEYLVDGINRTRAKIIRKTGEGETSVEQADFSDHAEALAFIAPEIEAAAPAEIAAVGHRVVHGGEKYRDTILIDDAALAGIEKLSDLAPLHNPPNIAGIRACLAALPNAPAAAVFDTAFHADIPAENYRYAIAQKYYQDIGLRKYGFHGTSHCYVSRRAYELLGSAKGRVIIAHLGNGSSISAVADGVCRDTSMGFTPLDGVIMGGRCGQIDPGAVLRILEEPGVDAARLSEILNRESGLIAICGKGDLREIISAADADDADCALALKMLARSIRHYIGAYTAELGGVDALVFTGGIGENSPLVRQMVCERLGFLGLAIDNSKNDAAEIDISADGAGARVLVIPTDEELEIARRTAELIGRA